MTQLPAMTTEQWLAYQNWLGQNNWQQQQQANQQQQQAQNQNNALNAQYQQQMDRANFANENRYNDILQLLGVNKNQVLGDINQWGGSQVADANERYKNQAGAATADAWARGFGGSPSVLAAGRNQANRSRDLELNRIRDAQIQQRTNANLQTTGNIAGVMERRNDVGPDYNQLINLQQGLGRGGMAGGYQGYGQPGNQFSGGAINEPWLLHPRNPNSRTPMYPGDPGYMSWGDNGQYFNQPQGNAGGFIPRQLFGQQGRDGSGFGSVGSQQAYIPLSLPKTPAATPEPGSQQRYVNPGEGLRPPLPSDYGRTVGGPLDRGPQYRMDGNTYSPTQMPVQQQIPLVPGARLQDTYSPGQGQPYPVYLPYPGQQGGYPQQPYQYGPYRQRPERQYPTRPAPSSNVGTPRPAAWGPNNYLGLSGQLDFSNMPFG